MTLEDLIQSKIYVKEGSAMNFNAPKEYIQPFIDEVSKLTDKFRVEAVSKVTNLDTDTENENTAWGRFKIEALMPSSFDIQDSESTIGLIVALDSAKPVMKIYSGKNVKACINLCIFNPDYVYTQEMTGNAKSVYIKAHEYVQSMQESLEEFNKRVTQMKETIYSGKHLERMHGVLIEGALKNPKLGVTPIMQGIKELINNKSVYYAKNHETTAWNYYNSITEYIKNADVLDRPTKTLALSDLFLRQN